MLMEYVWTRPIRNDWPTIRRARWLNLLASGAGRVLEITGDRTLLSKRPGILEAIGGDFFRVGSDMNSAMLEFETENNIHFLEHPTKERSPHSSSR